MNKFSKVVSLSDPILGETEKQAICEVIDSGWITMGEKVKQFEEQFAQLHGAIDAVAVSSCTAGLHLALDALGVGPGDEVLIPSLTFVATANAVLYVGAKPVFIDIEAVTKPHICIDAAQRACTKKTKAIILMHYGGYIMDTVAWREFADRNNLLVIEDAAHACGEKSVGQVSDVAVFSFFSNKNMTTAEGGMLIARNGDVLNKTRLKRAHGMTSMTLDRYKGNAQSYDVVSLGYNYRMDEIRAAIGIVQLAKLLQWNDKRRSLNKLYREKIKVLCPDLSIPFKSDASTVAHIMPVLLPDYIHRVDFINYLRDHGVFSSLHYPPVHQFTYYRENLSEVSLPITEAYAKRQVTIPLHPSMTTKDVEFVVSVLADAIEVSKNLSPT